MKYCIEVDCVSKDYKDKKVLSDVTFQIEKGSVVGLLGRNGAGKSTIIKLIIGLLHPTKGRIMTNGKKPFSKHDEIGYLPENIALYLHLNAYDNLKIFSQLANSNLTKQEIRSILDRVNIPYNKDVKSFSLGMKRRLQLAIALLIKDYDLLILDEPTNGLDIEGLLWFKGVLDEMRNQGKTILISSHSITDLQECLSHFMILNKGSIVEYVSLNEIVQKSEIKIKVDDCDKSKLEQTLECNGIVLKKQDDYYIINSDQLMKEIMNILNKNEIIPLEIAKVKFDLVKHFTSVIEE